MIRSFDTSAPVHWRACLAVCPCSVLVDRDSQMLAAGPSDNEHSLGWVTGVDPGSGQRGGPPRGPDVNFEKIQKKKLKKKSALAHLW